MKALVKIKSEVVGCELVNSVNARDLHKALDITKEFATWIKTQIDRAGLEDNIDFIILTKKSAGRPTKEYIITADASKHISMMSRGKKAKEVRNYFIQIEKEYKKSLETSQAFIAGGYKSQISQKNKQIEELKNDKYIFMNDAQLHNNFLDFLYQANKATAEVGLLSQKHPKSKNLSDGHKSMSNFLLFMTKRYENVRGIDKYK